MMRKSHKASKVAPKVALNVTAPVKKTVRKSVPVVAPRKSKLSDTKLKQVVKSDSNATLNEPSKDFMKILERNALIIQKWWRRVISVRASPVDVANTVEPHVPSEAEEALQRRQERAMRARMVLSFKL
jgi:hypothetical protein